MYLNIRDVRKRKHASAEDMGKSIGKTKLTYYAKERGDYPFTQSEMQKISKCLRLSDEEIILAWFRDNRKARR